MYEDKARKPKTEFAKVRTVFISFVPEEVQIGKHSTRTWADEFGKHLKRTYPGKPVINVCFEGAVSGFHQDDPRNAAGPSLGNADGKLKHESDLSTTDFLMLHTLDYASTYELTPPPSLARAMADNQSVNSHGKILLWVAKLDPEEFFASNFGESQDWHVLCGTEKNDRFKHIGEGTGPAWMQEQTDAANLIRDHSDCEHPSPVCPKHRPAGPEPPPPSWADRLCKLFGRRKP